MEAYPPQKKKEKTLGISGIVVLQLREASGGIVGNVVLRKRRLSAPGLLRKIFALNRHKGERVLEEQ